MKLFFLTKLPKNSKICSEKFFFTGKSYKISAKQSFLHLRFNRVNRTILVAPNSNFRNKNGLKKLVISNGTLFRSQLNKILNSARRINTYTLRGLYSSTTQVGKRAGRISEYM